MAKAIVPHFHNDAGVPRVRIGVAEFMCIGAMPPFDHPHVYLDMGDDAEKVCPYCSTLYVHDRTFAPTQSDPPGLLADMDVGEADKLMGDPPIADNIVEN